MQGPFSMFAPLTIRQQQFAANTVWIHALCCQNFKLRRQQNARNLNMPITDDCKHFSSRKKWWFKEVFPAFLTQIWQKLSSVDLENWGEKSVWLKNNPTCWSIAELGGLELRLLAATLQRVNNGTSKALITPNPQEKLKKNPDAECFHCSWWIISYIWWEGQKLFLIWFGFVSIRGKLSRSRAPRYRQ